MKLKSKEYFSILVEQIIRTSIITMNTDMSAEIIMALNINGLHTNRFEDGFTYSLEEEQLLDKVTGILGAHFNSILTKKKELSKGILLTFISTRHESIIHEITSICIEEVYQAYLDAEI